MSDDLVTFNIRFEKSLYKLKISTPVDAAGFMKELKNELHLKDTDKLVVLCPTVDGKMMEIKSDEDINFLKKTKLCYNAVSKEIYCSVELVVIILHEQLPDDPKFQLLILSNKIDQLASQINELPDLFDKKVEEYSSNILEKMMLMIVEKSKTEEKLSNVNSTSGEPISHKGNKEKKKLPTNSLSTSTSIDDKPKLSENQNQPKKSVNKNSLKETDDLLEILAKEGYTNTIQNIIVLKRFSNDYEKALNYLKTCAAQNKL